MLYVPRDRLSRLTVATFADVVALGLESDGLAVLVDEPRLADAVVFSGTGGPDTARLLVNRSPILPEQSIAMIPVTVLLGLVPSSIVAEAVVPDESFWFGECLHRFYTLDLNPLWKIRAEA